MKRDGRVYLTGYVPRFPLSSFSIYMNLKIHFMSGRLWDVKSTELLNIYNTEEGRLNMGKKRIISKVISCVLVAGLAATLFNPAAIQDFESSVIPSTVQAAVPKALPEGVVASNLDFLEDINGENAGWEVHANFIEGDPMISTQEIDSYVALRDDDVNILKYYSRQGIPATITQTITLPAGVYDITVEAEGRGADFYVQAGDTKGKSVSFIGWGTWLDATVRYTAATEEDVVLTIGIENTKAKAFADINLVTIQKVNNINPEDVQFEEIEGYSWQDDMVVNGDFEIENEEGWIIENLIGDDNNSYGTEEDAETGNHYLSIWVDDPSEYPVLFYQHVDLKAGCFYRFSYDYAADDMDSGLTLTLGNNWTGVFYDSGILHGAGIDEWENVMSDIFYVPEDVDIVPVRLKGDAAIGFHGHFDNIKVWRYAMTPIPKKEIAEIAKVEDVEITEGDDVTLPETVVVTYGDGTTTVVDIMWSEDDLKELEDAEEGEYEIRGTILVQGEEIEVKGKVKVNASEEPPKPRVWPFCDFDENATGADQVLKAYDLGILSGFGKNEEGLVYIKPNKDVTREQFAIYLYNGAKALNLIKEEKEYTESAFTDLKTTSAGFKAVMWASENGIISGFEQKDGTYVFKPTKNIIRAQIALMTYKFAEFAGYSIEDVADISDFGDADQVTNETFRKAVGWAYAAGVLSGSKDKNTGKMLIKPNRNATRAQSAMFIVRLLDR